MRDPLPASKSIEPEASTTASMADGTLSWLHEKHRLGDRLATPGGREDPAVVLARRPEPLVGDQRATHRALEVLGESLRQRTRARARRRRRTMSGKSRTGAPTAGVRSRRSARPSTASSCCSVATTRRGERRANMAGWTVASSPSTVRALRPARRGPGAGGQPRGCDPRRGPRPPARSPRGRRRRTTPGWARTPSPTPRRRPTTRSAARRCRPRGAPASGPGSARAAGVGQRARGTARWRGSAPPGSRRPAARPPSDDAPGDLDPRPQGRVDLHAVGRDVREGGHHDAVHLRRDDEVDAAELGAPVLGGGDPAVVAGQGEPRRTRADGQSCHQHHDRQHGGRRHRGAAGSALVVALHRVPTIP